MPASAGHSRGWAVAVKYGGRKGSPCTAVCWYVSHSVCTRRTEAGCWDWKVACSCAFVPLLFWMQQVECLANLMHAGAEADDWHGRIPGDAHRGGDAPDHQAQLPGHGHPRSAACRQGGVHPCLLLSLTHGPVLSLGSGQCQGIA